MPRKSSGNAHFLAEAFPERRVGHGAERRDGNEDAGGDAHILAGCRGVDHGALGGARILLGQNESVTHHVVAAADDDAHRAVLDRAGRIAGRFDRAEGLGGGAITAGRGGDGDVKDGRVIGKVFLR
jgi:hypothetical protein